MKTLSKIFTIICVALVVWGAFSYIEIISKNAEPNPQYSSTNLWVNIFEEVR